MLKDFNLIVSTYRSRENDCISELWYFLKNLGDPRVKASRTGLPGLIVAKTSLNPFWVIEKLNKIFKENPWEFRYILKIVPVETVIETNLEEIAETALDIANAKISQNETYKIVVRKRLTTLSKEEIISNIAPKFERKVDLTSPDKILLIEIIGDYTGLAVIDQEHVFAPQKMRRNRRNII